MSEFNDTFAMCLIFALFVTVIFMVTATIVISLYVIGRIIFMKYKNMTKNNYSKGRRL